MGFHAIQLPKVVRETFESANIDMDQPETVKRQIAAVAVTNRPGLKGSLA